MVRRVIVAVHGTRHLLPFRLRARFTKSIDQTPWTAPDSRFMSGLKAILGDATEVASFDWSGDNTFRARQEAAVELREFILQHRAPASALYVIAHSHGGNIALSAASDPFVADSLEGVILLSTPFINVRRRNWGAAIKWLPLACLISVLMIVCLIVLALL
jgi:hypothetical protein